MYKFNRNHPYTLDDFNQPMEFIINQNNRWVKKAVTIPWDDIGIRYAELFSTTTRNVGKTHCVWCWGLC